MVPGPNLPIDAVLPELLGALRDAPAAVLIAPPGAGKTTRVPLALIEPGSPVSGRIIVLEPRRLAARAAAERMARLLGEKVGETVGLRVRLGSRISAKTRVEIVTDGVFARMILADPELEGVGAVLFDEYHERSLDADLGLALARDAQAGLREDLRLLVMSATLDGARVAGLLGDAPVIESAGRAFPVETVYLGRDPSLRIEQSVAAAVVRAVGEEEGGVLVFLPGAGEIRRTAEILRERFTGRPVDVHELYGALAPAEQDRAIAAPPPGRRKVVLATSIAETSLTIEDVRVVVDSGLARVPVFEPAVGLTRLMTRRASRAAVDQRRGRAGRVAPGTCYRLWEEAATGALPAFADPEILAADLSGLVLDLAEWGVWDPASLQWLDPPPEPAIAEARRLLRLLGALDEHGRITARGRAIRDLPLPPRLAAMVVDAAAEGDTRRACEIALLLVERGLGGEHVDIGHRLHLFARDRSRRADDARRLARSWEEGAGGGRGQAAGRSVGEILARAFPDRVAQARGAAGEFRLANGRGAALDPADALAREPFIVVAELTGSAAGARIVAAAPLSRAEIESGFAGSITQDAATIFDRSALALRARRTRRLGALVLADDPLPVAADHEASLILADGLAALGIDRLPVGRATAQWRDRVAFMRSAEGEAWPDLSDATLAATARGWLAPFILGKTALSEIRAGDVDAALRALLAHALARRLDAEAPTHFAAPSGSSLPIDYSQEEPKLAVRVQELFGLSRHPGLAGGRVPLVLELLSPAHRPVQVTRDLPGFWRGSWAAVRAEMRGRYPRHPWPEDPSAAVATNRAKPRGT